MQKKIEFEPKVAKIWYNLSEKKQKFAIIWAKEAKIAIIWVKRDKISYNFNKTKQNLL